MVDMTHFGKNKEGYPGAILKYFYLCLKRNIEEHENQFAMTHKITMQDTG